MAELGIDELKKVVKNASLVANGVDQLRAVDLKKVLDQALDLTEAEAKDVAAELEILDLSDDALELKIKLYADIGADYIVYVLKILRLIMPKK